MQIFNRDCDLKEKKVNSAGELNNTVLIYLKVDVLNHESRHF
jgi:hypothetical protein